MVYLGCKYGGQGGQGNDFAVLQNIWNNGFSKNELTNANNQRLYYYKTYNSSATTLPGLLAAPHDGQCETWAALLRNVASAQGIADVDIFSSPPQVPVQDASATPLQAQVSQFATNYEQLMVNNWSFPKLPEGGLAPVRASLANVQILQVVNFNDNGNLVPVPQSAAFQQLLGSCYAYANILTKEVLVSTNGYNFQSDKTDVARVQGVQGKGPVASPLSIFGGHWGCQYYDSKSNKTYLYDPSYGGGVLSATGNARASVGQGAALTPTQKELGLELQGARPPGTVSRYKFRKWSTKSSSAPNITCS